MISVVVLCFQSELAVLSVFILLKSHKIDGVYSKFSA